MKKILKFAGMLLALLLVLAGAAYGVVSSQWFITRQILPRVSAALGVPVTVEGVTFSPFSSLEMTSLRVGTPAHPLATAKTVRVRYDALAALGKTLRVSELLVDGAKVTLEQQADGTWNLPPAAAPAAQAPAGVKSAPGAFPFALDLRNLRIVNAELALRQAGPAPATVTVRGFALSIPAVQPGKPLDVTVSALVTAARNGEMLADLPVTLHAATPVMPGVGALPETLEVQLRAGDAVPAEPPVGRAATAILRLTPAANGRQCTLTVAGRLAKDWPTNEFDLRVTGTAGAQPFPMTLAITAAFAPAPATLRALAKPPLAPFTGSYTGTLTLASADRLATAGSLKLDRLGLADSATGPKLPPLSLVLEHATTLDLAAKSATVSILAGRAVQDGRDLVAVTLSAPATVAWGGAKGTAAAPAKLALAVKDLDTAALAPFLPARLPVAVTGGILNANAGLVVEKQGAAVTFDVTATGTGLRLRQGLRDLPVFSCRQRLTGTFTDFRRLSAQAECSVSLPESAGQPALQAAVTGAATADLTDAAGKLEKAALRVRQAERTVVTAELAAPVTLTWGAPDGFAAGDAELRLAVDAFGLTQANAFLPPAAPRLSSGTLGAAITAKLAEKGTLLRATGDWSVQDLRLTDSGAAISVKNALDLAFLPQSRELRIATCTFTAWQGDTPLADLAITASNAGLPPFANRPMTLNLAGSTLDLRAIQLLAAQFTPPKTTAPVTPQPRPPATEPPPVDLQGLRATVALNLKKITYGGLAVTDLVTTLEVKDNSVTVHPSTLVVNGAAAAFRGTANLGGAPWTYGLSATLDRLAIAPLVDAFAPQFKDMISGEVKSVTVAAAGTGVTPDNLSRHFTGGATLEARDVTLRNVRQFIAGTVGQKTGVQAVAELITELGIGDLQQLTFDTAKVNLTAAGGRLQVTEGLVTGPDLVITRTAGDSIGFDQTLDLKLRAGFGGGLEKHIRSLRLGALLGPREGSHAMFVKPIVLRGTFAAPDTSGLDWKKLLRDIAKDKAVEAGASALQDYLKSGKVDTKKLRNTLLNETATGSSTPSAPAAAPEAAAAPAQAPDAPTPTSTSPSAEPSKKKKNRDAFLKLGSGLLNDVLQK